jgi:protein-disulfide isomerase
MASRKEQKEAAREARLAAEQAAAAKSAQRQRYGIIGGVVVVAVIIAVVAIVVSSNSASNKGKHVSQGLASTKSQSEATYDSVATELKGIPQSGQTLGKPSAPVTIEYFGDLECPICQEFTLGEESGGLPALIAGPVKDGEVKLVYKSFETATGGVNNDRWIPQQTAAYAAGQQHLFWDYAELFYHEQGSEDDHYVTEAYLEGLAKQIPGLNFAKWMAARKEATLAADVKADGQLASQYGLTGTPTLVAIGSKGKEIVPSGGIPTISDIDTAIKSVGGALS